MRGVQLREELNRDGTTKKESERMEPPINADERR